MQTLTPSFSSRVVARRWLDDGTITPPVSPLLHFPLTSEPVLLSAALRRIDHPCRSMPSPSSRVSHEAPPPETPPPLDDEDEDDAGGDTDERSSVSSSGSVSGDATDRDASREEKEEQTEEQEQEQEEKEPSVVVPHKKEVSFTWRLTQASSVFLVASFNRWDPAVCPLCPQPQGAHAVSLPLAPGKYHYKFVVDGHWFYDITLPTEVDPLGNVNNVLLL